MSNYYTHPDFGFLAPAPRLRRELRLAVLAGLCGAAIGAAGVIGLVIAGRHDGLASATHAPPTQAHPQPGSANGNPPAFTTVHVASNASADSTSGNRLITGSPANVMETNNGTDCKARSSVSLHRHCSLDKPYRVPLRGTGNGPDIARVPLGHPAAPTAAVIAAQTDHVSVPSELATPTPADAQPLIRAPAIEQVAASAAPHTAPAAAAASPQQIVRPPPARNNDNKESAATAARVSAAAHSPPGKLGSAYARDISYPRTVFWDWSR